MRINRQLVSMVQPSDTSRGQGGSVRSRVSTQEVERGSDPARIFVTGMSAGVADDEVMMATYTSVRRGRV